ncbi:hypothetical protein COR50_20725 [Chitinophaga caeni]|uniref:Uncharacterized protein n=1 Tax=Chitinophaga caeni TaxID=2029983 RepID=A0A291QZI8_9BACT|nr:hypothetical protein COR50_20725 [Chitinophaga caeni]
MQQSLSKKILVNLLLNTAITVAVFYLLFRLSVLVVSFFHEWERSLQRGIFWETYLYSFAGVVLLLNLIFLFLPSLGIRSRMLLNGMGIIVLVVVFFKSFRFIAYSTLLPHIIAAIILIVLPLVIYQIPFLKRLYLFITGMKE